MSVYEHVGALTTASVKAKERDLYCLVLTMLYGSFDPGLDRYH